MYWRSPPRSHLSRRSFDFAQLSAILNCETKTLFSKNKIRIYSARKKFTAFQSSTRNRVSNRRIEKGSSRRRLGKGVQVLVRYLKIVYSKQPAFVATLDQPTFEQPQAHGKNLSGTCSVKHVDRVLQSQNQSHLLLTSSMKLIAIVFEQENTFFFRSTSHYFKYFSEPLSQPSGQPG